jgi:hypothetical protein
MAKRRLRPKFTEEDLGNNRFTNVSKLTIPVKPGLDSFTDKAGKTHYKEKHYEKDKYCRMYNSPENRLEVSKLSYQAKDLLLWIMYELDPGKDYVWINRERYMEESGVKSPTTVSLAVRELKLEFIMPCNVREMYFINPKYMFFGSRINAFGDNVKVVK